jgi:Coenzyme PQQ synthesis protein D (PqqD)
MAVTGMRIAAGTTLQRTERAVQGDPPEAAVLLDPDAGVALRLNSTGAWIWEQLDSPCRVQELANGLAQHFEIDPGRALDDVVAFAREMARHELLAAS